jgi:hypothetical protein
VTVMLLAIIGFMACVFYVFVLIEWVRDAKRAKTIVSIAEGRATPTRQQVRARVVGFQKDAVRGRRSAQPPLVPSTTERHFQASGPRWNALERNVYETIARSLADGRNARVSARSGATTKAS